MKQLKLILFSILFFALSELSYGQTVSENDSSIILAHAGMTVDEFNQLLKTDKYILADFYADWCAPCKKLEPVIYEIANEMKKKVRVIRISQDDNKSLFDALRVYELPTLLIYKNETIKWTGEGYFPKEMITENFK